MSNKRIPRKKGQPAGSDKHSDLYTDENPKGTIHGLKFATVEDAKASVAKIKKSGRSHAHKIQAAIAMEQRARVMGKAGAANVYRKFINAMKQKTKDMKENKGLWANIAAKRERIKRGSGERMRKKGEKGAPTQDAIASAKRKSAANMGESSHPNIWDNIRKRRAAGKPRLKPGQKGYPKTLDLPEEVPGTNTTSIPNPADTAMGPRFKTTTTQDKRKKKRPAVLKRFARFIEPQND